MIENYKIDIEDIRKRIPRGSIPVIAEKLAISETKVRNILGGKIKSESIKLEVAEVVIEIIEEKFKRIMEVQRRLSEISGNISITN